MRVSITKAIDSIMSKHFREMLLAGAFPKIDYHVTEIGSENAIVKSYNLFEYSNTWATYAKVIDKKMKESLDPRLGVFTRKHSGAFLDDVKKIVNTVTEAEVLSHNERFRSFADAVLAEAMK